MTRLTLENRPLNNRLMRALLTAAVISAVALFGCGGGGGGAPPANVIGRILSASSGAAISGVTVSAGGASFVTIADGSFTLQNIPSNSTQITVSGTGIKTLTQTLPTLTPNSTNDLRDIFVLDNSDPNALYNAVLRSQVVRADNLNPVAGATVNISGQVATTDTNGNFSFSNLPAGLGGFTTPVGVVRATGFEDKPVVFEFPLAASPPDNVFPAIQIAVPVGSDPPGGPFNITGKVSLSGNPPPSDLSFTNVTLINKANGATVGTVSTRADGRFGFWVVGGSYTVRAEHVGYTTQNKDVQVATPDDTEVVDFTL
jgi:hypothetical protein